MIFLGSRSRDLTGETFGEWKVLGLSHKDTHSNRRWSCVCSCGRTSTVATYALLSGHSKACGKCKYANHRDLTGEIFGEWKVLGLSHKDAKCQRHWLCLCSCGKQSTVVEYALLDGNSKSCRNCCNKYTDHSHLAIDSIDPSKMRSNNTSGIKGVSFDKSHDKWLARIRMAGKIRHLGYFETKEGAAVARERAVEQKKELLRQEGLI